VKYQNSINNVLNISRSSRMYARRQDGKKRTQKPIMTTVLVSYRSEISVALCATPLNSHPAHMRVRDPGSIKGRRASG